MTGGSPRLALRPELARKALHLVTLVVPVSWALGAPRAVIIAVLALAVVVAQTVELLRARHAAARALFDRAVGPLLRAHEHDAWSGATWLFLAFLGAALALPARVAIAAMCAVSLGDASAAIVGRSVGRLRVGTSHKSLEGTLACALVTTAAALGIAHLVRGEAIVAGVTAALAERPTRPLDDNVRIVLAVGAGILLWRIAFS